MIVAVASTITFSNLCFNDENKPKSRRRNHTHISNDKKILNFDLKTRDSKNYSRNPDKI